MNYRIILLATFFLTVVFDLTVAVEPAWCWHACSSHLHRMSELTCIERRPLREAASEPQFLYPDGTMRVAAWKLFGSLFFGAVNKLEELGPCGGAPGNRHPRHEPTYPTRHHRPEGLESLQ